MDTEDRNSKIGELPALLSQLEKGKRALNSIISETLSEEKSTDTENLNLKIGEAAGVLYHRLEEGECTLNQIKNHLPEKDLIPQLR